MRYSKCRIVENVGEVTLGTNYISPNSDALLRVV